MLPQAEQQVGAGQHQAGTGRARFAVPEAENQHDDQHQGKYRVDDRDDAPCDTGIAEGPQQMGAVAGAGIEQTAGGVTEQREAIDFLKTRRLRSSGQSIFNEASTENPPLLSH